jgi:hypothetical protein
LIFWFRFLSRKNEHALSGIIQRQWNKQKLYYITYRHSDPDNQVQDDKALGMTGRIGDDRAVGMKNRLGYKSKKEYITRNFDNHFS